MRATWKGLLGAVLILWGGFARALEAEAAPQDFFWLEVAVGASAGVLTGPGAVALSAKAYCRGAEQPQVCEQLAFVILTPAVSLTLLPAGVAASVVLTGWINGVQGNLPAAALLGWVGSVSGVAETALVIAAIELLSRPQAYAADNPDALVRLLPPQLVEVLTPVSRVFAPVAPTLKTMAFVLLTPLTTALFATMGYNMGAEMRTFSGPSPGSGSDEQPPLASAFPPASSVQAGEDSGWIRLPLFTLRF